MRTFGELKNEFLSFADCKNHCELIDKDPVFKNLWELLNRIEYDRGYDHDEYLKPDSPQLCDMKLLTQREYEIWIELFKAVLVLHRFNQTP